MSVSGGSQVDSLRWVLGVARDSIGEVEPDKRSPLIAQYRAVLAEIAELEGAGAPVVEGKVNGLVILQEELDKRRQSGASGSRRTGTRSV